VMHGYADDHIKPDKFVAVCDELTKRKADFYAIAYGHAPHGFTHKDQPERYNAQADTRSWIEVKNFLAEVFAD